MQLLRSITTFIGQVWSKGCLGKGIVVFVALIVLGMCSSLLGGNRREPALSTQPTIAPAAVVVQAATTAPEPTGGPPSPEPTIADTASPVVLIALATDAPTEQPTAAAPTRTPITIPTLAGASPQGEDCPADHPVKGNIVDRGENKGEKIYHVPGGPSYKATKPERCFVDTKEAEAAGFRAPK